MTATKLYRVGRTPFDTTVTINNQQVTTKFYLVKADAIEAIMEFNILSQTCDSLSDRQCFRCETRAICNGTASHPRVPTQDCIE